jgi:RNA polymerase sigma factor (sigma-70 family)
MDGRRARFDAQVVPHVDAAYRFARWLARSSEGADDVVQEAILRAYRGYDGLRGSDAKAWLLTIVRNCHTTALKQQQRREQVPLPEEHDPQDGGALIATTPDPESFRSLCCAMRAMTPFCDCCVLELRVVVRWKYASSVAHLRHRGVVCGLCVSIYTAAGASQPERPAECSPQATLIENTPIQAKR